MIDIKTGELKDIWPDETSPEFLSISYAIKLRIADIIARAAKVGIYYDIDSLDEEILDYLAIEMKAPYYSQDLPIEKKRILVKSAILWRSKAGTSGSVQELIKTIFGSGELEEWYENGGDVDTFEVVLESGQADSEDIERITAILEQIKNVRSHYAGLTFQDKKALKLKIEDDTAYKYEVPKCGTMPYPAAIGRQDIRKLKIGKYALAAAAKILSPGEKPTAGTQPYTSEMAVIDKAAAKIKTNEVSAKRQTLMPSDTAVAGTTPTVSEAAVIENVAVTSQKAEASGAHPVMKPSETARPRE